MAKALKGRPKSGPDPAIVKEIADEVAGRLNAQPPAGAAAFALPQFDIKKISSVVTFLLEISGLAAQGKLSPETARKIADLIYELVVKLRVPA